MAPSPLIATVRQTHRTTFLHNAMFAFRLNCFSD
jgi:hypothetical protein